MEPIELAEPSPRADAERLAGSWLEVIPTARRTAALLWRAALGILVAALLVRAEWPAPIHRALPLLPPLVALGLGIHLGWKAFRRDHVRRFTMTRVRYSRTRRLQRAAIWWIYGAVIAVLVGSVQYAQGTFATTWWYVWPAAIPLAVGAGLYLLRAEVVLSPSAAASRAEVAARGARARMMASRLRWARLDRTLASWPGRYAMAVAIVALALWVSDGATGTHRWLIAGAGLLSAACLAFELARLLLLCGIAVAVATVLAAGLKSVPIAVVILVAAWMVAKGLRQR